MMLRRAGLLAATGLVLFAGLAPAQKVDVDAELKFIAELRKRGYTDLAVEYLDRLKKNPSPELAKVLPLATANTRFERAGEEGDPSKRLSMYEEARKEFEDFLKANPNAPQAAEVRLQLAHLAGAHGKAVLAKAMMLPQDDPERKPQLLKARGLLDDAFKKISDEMKKVEAE